MALALSLAEWPELPVTAKQIETQETKSLARCTQSLLQQPNTTLLSLEALPEDLLHMIVATVMETRPRTIAILAQTCRKIRRIALPYAYYTLELSQRSSPKFRFMPSVVMKNIEGAADLTIVKYIREIIVKDGHSTKDLTEILEKIAVHGRLRKLRSVDANHRLLVMH